MKLKKFKKVYNDSIVLKANGRILQRGNKKYWCEFVTSNSLINAIRKMVLVDSFSILFVVYI